MNCVRCDSELIPEIYEGVEIDRCHLCRGAWLDSGELTKIVENQTIPLSPEAIQETLALAFRGVPADEKRSREYCLVCRAVMEAINYDYSSGNILDRCPNGHGTWLDGGELEKVQAHSEHWESEARAHQDDWISFAKAVSGACESATDESRRRSLRPTRYLINSIIRRFLGG